MLDHMALDLVTFTLFIYFLYIFIMYIWLLYLNFTTTYCRVHGQNTYQEGGQNKGGAVRTLITIVEPGCFYFNINSYIGIKDPISM